MSLWKTAPNAPTCPFLQHMESAPKRGQLTLQTGHPECGLPSVAPAVQLCPSEGVVLGAPLHWEPSQRAGAGPQHIPQESTGTGRHSILLHRGKHRRMWFQGKVPRSAISKGASWEQGLCEDRSHTADGAAVGIDVVARGGTNSTAQKVPTHGATLRGKGTPPHRVRTCDMPPPCPAEYDPMPGARIGASGSEHGGSVCKLAGTGQGQEVLGGGWEGAGAVSAPQLGRDGCQHIPGAARQRVCVWAQGKCMAIADPATAHPPRGNGPTLPPGNLDRVVSPVMAQPPRPLPGTTRSEPCASSALSPARVLSPGSSWTP